MHDNAWDIVKGSFQNLLNRQMGVALVIAAVVAGVAGPFGTYSALPFAERMLYWGLIAPISVVLGCAGFAIARVLWSRERLMMQTVMGSAIGTVFITFEVWILTSPEIWSNLNRPKFSVLLSYVALISAAIGTFRYFLISMLSPQSDIGSTPQSGVVRPRLLRRLPESEQGDILHLSVRDHFIEVTTSRGTVEIRMRFRDAMDELDGIDGLQVHRSHWVATSSITAVERDQGRLFLNLSNGAKVPVSRSYRPALEKAGIY